MTLAPAAVVELQRFLIEAAKASVQRSGPSRAELLASAAALDYSLMLASERPAELTSDDAPATAGVRDALTHGARLALDVAAAFDAANDADDAFYRGELGSGRIFAALRELRICGAVTASDVTFRSVTTAEDLVVRRRPG